MAGTEWGKNSSDKSIELDGYWYAKDMNTNFIALEGIMPVTFPVGSFSAQRYPNFEIFNPVDVSGTIKMEIDGTVETSIAVNGQGAQNDQPVTFDRDGNKRNIKTYFEADAGYTVSGVQYDLEIGVKDRELSVE